LRDYELTVVFSPEISDEDLPAEIEKLNQLIAQKGGEVVETNRWGRRRLAYPIKRYKEGNYVLTLVKMDANMALDLDSSLGSAEQIIRYLLVRPEK
jgi:small subunit ribosomal protein S6